MLTSRHLKTVNQKATKAAGIGREDVEQAVHGIQEAREVALGTVKQSSSGLPIRSFRKPYLR